MEHRGSHERRTVNRLAVVAAFMIVAIIELLPL